MLVMYSDAAHANCASADAGAAPNTHTGYISCRKGPPIQDIAAWLEQINLCGNMQTCKATIKSALDANLSFAVLYYLKYEVMHIDIPNSVASIKHQVHCTNSACQYILLCLGL